MRTTAVRPSAIVDDPTDPRDSPDQERGAHLGFVAHEIRNPMSTALWTAELLVRMAPADRAGARGDKLTALCFRSLARVRLLVEDHLLCERLDAGGYPVRPEPLPLDALVEGVVAKLVPGGPGVERNLPDGLVVQADRPLLERAVDGLLGVAGREAEVVRVEARRDGAIVTLRVVGGPPLPLDDPHKGAPSDQQGRALALPMVRRVAAALGGSLAVDGEGYLLSIPSA